MKKPGKAPKGRPVGNCRLCGTNGPLEDSHIIPRWAYKNVTNKFTVLQVKLGGGIVSLSPSQDKEHMLCAQCERLFSKREAYLAKIVSINNGSFEASEKTRANVTLSYVGSDPVPKDASMLDCGAISYFAASVFWRASVATKFDYKLNIDVGRQVELANYLLADGAAPFPKSMTLAVEILERDDPTFPIDRVVAAPAAVVQNSTLQEHDELHWFVVPGICFLLFSSPADKSYLSQLDFNSTRQVWLNFLKRKIVDSLARTVAYAKRKGSLSLKLGPGK